MKRLGSLAVMLLLPLSASAIELDYYTYNGFEETVAAFERLALILNDTSFWVLAGIVVLIGIVFGAMGTAVKGMSGGQANPIGWAIPILVGAALARGLLVPTGSIHVYDPVRNAYQEVVDVPDMVVLIAGVMSKIERSMSEVVDAASANPYSEQAGSMSFSLVQSALTTSIDNSDLVTSLERYYADCGTFAIRTGYNGASMSELRRTSTDLKDTYAKFAHPSIYTVVYTAGNSGGTVKTCQEAWQNDLNPALDGGAAATFQSMREALCQRSGFNTGNATQMARCDDEIDNATALYGLPAASSTTFLRSVLLAKSTMDALDTEDLGEAQTALINRQMMAEGFGAATAMNEWAPKMRGFLVAITLGIIPVALLFVATPLVFKALFLIMGMFVWVSLWGVMDIVAAQMARDAAVDAFSQVQRYNMGLDAILMSPEASVKALGIFGKARGMALMLATFIAMTLFRFGGYALTQAAGDLQSHVNQIGEDAGRTTMLPEQSAAMMRSLAGAPGAAAMQASGGFDRHAFNSARQDMQGLYDSNTMINKSLEGGNTPSYYMERTGMESAGGFIGRVEGTQSVASDNGMSVSDVGRRSGEVDSIERNQSSITKGDFADERYGGMGDYARINAGFAAGDTAAKGSVYEEISGEGTYENNSQWEQVGRLTNASYIGASQAVTPQEQVKRFQVETEIAATQADEISKRGTEETIGRNEGANRSLAAQGETKARTALGDEAAQKGYEYNYASQAGRGKAAGEVDDVSNVAEGIARTDIASAAASSEVARDAARFLGLDPASMAGLVESEETQRGATVKFSLNDENRDAIINNLKEDGRLDNWAIENHLRNKGGSVTVAMDRDGNAVGLDVVAGDKSQVFDLASEKVGVESHAVDISERTIDRSETFRGDVAFTNNARDADAAFGYIFAAGQEAVANQTLYDSFLSQVSQAENVQGFKHAASETNYDNTSNQLGGGVSWDSERMALGQAIQKATGLSANLGDRVQRVDGQSDENSISADPVISSARFIADMTRVEAVNQAREEYDLVSLSQVEALRTSEAEEARERYRDYVNRVDELHGQMFTETWSDVIQGARDTLDDVKYGHELTDSAIDKEVAKAGDKPATENPGMRGYRG